MFFPKGYRLRHITMKFAAVALCMATLSAQAQTPAPATPPVPPKVRLILNQNVDEVQLSVSVVDSSGLPVKGLQQSDFHIFEDKVPQTIDYFHSEDVPVSIGILIDNSASMGDKRQAVNKAALDLVRSSNPLDEAFIVNFSDVAYLDTDFTSDIAKLNDGLSHISSNGGTALYDAVIAAADHLAAGSHRSKQVLLIITDGQDTESTTSLQAAISRVQDMSGPEIYAIGLLFGQDEDNNGKKAAKHDLQNMTDETGGLALFPKSLKDVDGIAAQIARDIRSQYILGYSSTHPVEQGGYRAVHVEAKAKGHGKLTVRSRAGYMPKSPEAETAPAAQK